MTAADEAEAAYKWERREFAENWNNRLADRLFQTIDRDEVAAVLPLIEAAVERLALLSSG